MSKILVAYFSQSGNTARAAEAVARAVGAKTYEIEPSEKYPADYNKCIAEAKREKEGDARPALKSSPAEAVKEADIVFLGYPIWWYDAPMLIYSFIDACDFKGKRVIPFATSGGSGMSGSDERIAKEAGVKKETGYISRFRLNVSEIEKWAKNAVG